MSEVERIDSEKNETIPTAVDLDNTQVLKTAPPPVLRIEELRDEFVSELIISDEDYSHGETSDRDGGGSGECKTEVAFVEPDEELIDKIIKQVEFYFSDANILKDAFLLKHVRRNKQGFVSLKLITSFKKVKSLTKDYRVVAHSLKLSKELEVNEECTKVRRISPLPEYDETTPSRTVVVVNLTMELPTIENVAELFSKYGEIVLVRILRPGKSIPADVKKHVSKHPEIGSVTCAIIEFEHHDSAKSSVLMNNNINDNWREGMRVVLLSGKKNKIKKDKDEKKTNDNDNIGSDCDVDKDSVDVNDNNTERKKKKPNRRKNSRIEQLKDASPYTSSGSEGDSDSSLGPRRISAGSRSPRNSLSPKQDSPTNHRSPRRISGHGHGRSPLAVNCSPKNSPHGSPEMKRKINEPGSGNAPCSPWMARRMAASQATSTNVGLSPGASPLMSRRCEGTVGVKLMSDMQGVMRLPRGPDGTKGFGVGRGKDLNEVL